jgi:mannan endo-1,6-alpha-mannosidase
MGIDDQVFWAFSAMDAAEANFPAPPSDQPSWLALAQAVFNFQTAYWDTATCNGGFRWQVYSFNAGYNLKNTIANGGNFQLAARLARYTGNQTYADWAENVWDWIYQSKLITYQGDTTIVHDSTDVNDGCTDSTGYYWTYNYGTLLVGAAYMYNYTNGNSTWGARVQTLLNSGYSVLYPTQYGGNIVVEVCEPSLGCNNDQSSFKAYWSRWLAVTAQLAPFTYDQIMPKLQQNAIGAAAQCTGGANGRMCGREWYTATWDGSSGVGQQMSALSVISAQLITPAMAPLSKDTGGTSKSDPNAGTAQPQVPLSISKPITSTDRAGAGILTVICIFGIIGLSIWIIL